MKIQNLGPIKDLELDLNKMNVFVGENGTGKTIAAYATYSFVYWFYEKFVVDAIDWENIKEIVCEEKSYLYPIDKIIKQAVEEFNELDFKYFDDFFNHTGLYKEGVSQIKVTPNDFNRFGELLTHGHDRRWYWDWPANKDSEDFEMDKNSINSNYENNRIYFMINDNANGINIFYKPARGISSDLYLSQFEALKSSQAGPLKMSQGRVASNFTSLGVSAAIFSEQSVFYLPAERIGINVFRPNLNVTRLNEYPSLVHDLSLTSHMTKNQKEKRYAEPIEQYIIFVNNNVRKLNEKNEKIDESKLVSKLIPGNFSYEEETDSVKYQLPDSDSPKLDFEILSSSLKSVFSLDLFLRSTAKGSWLFFDEPEMNLHPENQRIIADLLYKLAKEDIKFIISTHSDYFTKELINCVLKDKLNGQENNEINVYEFKDGTATKINNIFNIDEPVNNFDDTTREINNEYYDIVDELENRGC